MIDIAIIVLAAAAAVFVLAPLRHPVAASPGGEDRDQIRRQEDAVSQALRDIELDYATGKLSREDYREFRARVESGTETPMRGGGSA